MQFNRMLEIREERQNFVQKLCVHQASTNWGPDLTLAVEANIKSLCPKLS